MPCAGQSHRFTHAITRLPARSCTQGLRAVDAGAPDHGLFLRQHAAYIAALEAAGVAVSVLPALEQFPDSVFVEDAALCLPEGAIALCPGAPSRTGEAAAIATELEAVFGAVGRLPAQGTVDGGDILTTESEVIVGLSERTSQTGAEALGRLLADWGYRLRIAETPRGILHFKSDCAILDEETILCTQRLAASGVFDGYRVMQTAAGEQAAANAVRINGRLFLPAGYLGTVEILSNAGYDVVILDISEAAKLDGGLSCMSLRFSVDPQNRRS